MVVWFVVQKYYDEMEPDLTGEIFYSEEDADKEVSNLLSYWYKSSGYSAWSVRGVIEI